MHVALQLLYFSDRLKYATKWDEAWNLPCITIPYLASTPNPYIHLQEPPTCSISHLICISPGYHRQPNLTTRVSRVLMVGNFVMDLRSRWQPQILRLPVTLTVVFVLLGIVAGLESFLRISHGRSGFAVPNRGALEVITYGPVLAFVAMGLVWRTWELEVKKLAPWTDMCRRPTPAKDSILLDYVGANYVEVIYRAIRHRHWPVLLAILGSVMLSICNIAATSFWSVSPQTLTTPIVIRQTTALGGGFNPNATGYLSSYFGHYLYNVPQPAWQYRGMALSSFHADITDHDSGVISTVTEGYSGTLNCESADALVDGPPFPAYDPAYHDPATSPYVQAVNIYWRGCQLSVNLTNYHYEGPSMLGVVEDMPCNSSHVSIIGIFTFSSAPAELTDMTVIACQHVYVRSSVSVNLNSSMSAVQGAPVVISSEPTTLPNGDRLLYWLLHSNLDTASSKQEYDRNQNDFAGPWVWPHDVLQDATSQDVQQGAIFPGTWVNLIGRVRNITTVDLMDHRRLGDLSRDVFEDMFPYIALDAYAEPSTQLMDGTRTVVEQRLVVKEISIRLVQSALCVLAVIALTLYILRPVTHLSGDPDSIIASAAILAASHGLVDYLASTSAPPEREFDARLRYTTCYTRPGHGRAAAILYASKSDRETDSPLVPLNISRSSEFGPVAFKFWQPFMLSLPAKAIMLGFVAVCVIGLELTLHRSERDGGLVDVATQTALSQHGIPYIAPVVLFVLGLMLASFDFAIRVTEPFRRLAAAPQSATALGFNPTFAGEYATMSHAICHGEFRIVLAASTSVLTLISKIAVAGLIFNGAKDASTPLELQLHSTFNSTFNSTLEFGLWQYVRDPEYVLSRPTFTTQAYAVANVSVALPPTNSSTRGIVASIPVAHASLGRCQRIQSTIRDVQPFGPDSVELKFNFTDYSLCAGASYDWNMLPGPDQHYLATVMDLSTVPGCGEQMHFVVVRDPLGPEASNITHLACDWDLVLSSMDLTLLATGRGNAAEILHFDTDSEGNRSRVPFIYSDELNRPWRITSNSQNFTAMLPDTYTDPFFTGLFAAQRAVNITAYLDPDYLETVIRSGWSDFWALQFDQKLRAEASGQIPATRLYTVTRATVAVVPTRILEGMLGAVFVIVAVVCALTPSRSVLIRPPFSIAAQMNLVIGTRLLKRIEEGGSLEGLRVKLGWWRDPSVEGWKRYGIDIVEEDEEQIPLHVMGESP